LPPAGRSYNWQYIRFWNGFGPHLAYVFVEFKVT
jgi:hypothetical protein